MCGGIRAAVDEKPSSSWLRGRYITPRRSVDGALRGCQRHVRYGDHAWNRSWKAARRTPAIERRNHGQSMVQRRFNELSKQEIVGPAEAEIDNLGLFLDREIQRFRQAEAVANRLPRHTPLDLPTGAEPKEPGAGSDSGNPDPIIRFGGDNARDASAVLLVRRRLVGDEVAIDEELAGEVRVLGLDAAVDNRDFDPATGGNPV